ncbi:hypothetical protein [Nocardia lasii]|uniref:Uncharacterized protein n=1 Tax=Nocardia lasii TaxID=1616107 RepID=A0ABW1JS95_9NOCA
MDEDSDFFNWTQVKQDEEYRYFVEALGAPVPELAITLRSLKKSVYPEARLIPHLKDLLSNRSVCKTQIPYRYGEVRWLAAGALRQVYDSLGIREDITLADVPVTHTGDEIDDLLWELGLQDRWMKCAPEECFERLRDAGKLLTRDVVLRWRGV